MIMGRSSLFSEFLLIATILFFPNININATCISSEKQALLDLKKDLIDPSGRLSFWIDDVDCCQWEGVVCGNKSGHVIQLHLRNSVRVLFDDSDYGDYFAVPDSKSELSGNINHSLQNLTHLCYLDLSLNNFSGIPIASFFGSLKSLRYLNLSQAGFQGIVPYQFGNLSSLRTLSIGGYQFDLKVFEEIIPVLEVDNLQWLAGLSSLEHLDLSFVNLSTASNWLEVINMIPSLIELHVSYCDLIQISQLVRTNFSSLTILDLSRDYFRHSIPRWIFGLTALVSLDLSWNSFEGPLPRGSVWNLTSLNHLDLSYNHLNGSLPDELISLNLEWNQFEGSLDGIRNLSSLKSLDLSFNNFATFLPTLTSTLTAVTSLGLCCNQFQGYIPGSIANISNLQYLDLSDNNLSSSLPSELSTLKDLIHLDASGNHLNGPIPSTLGNCTKLKFLGLGANNLSGSIPSNLGKLSSLGYLDISQNKLIGTLPESLAQLSNLFEFRIANNLMEGIVSESLLDNLTSLKYFNTSGNSLTLKVSASWIPRAQFNELELGSWKLGPQFPTWLRSQKYPLELNLSSAGISDTIHVGYSIQRCITLIFPAINFMGASLTFYVK